MHEMNEEAAATVADGTQAIEDSGPGAAGIMRGVVALALIVLATLFAVQNSESVDVSFLTWDFSVSKILLIVVSALIGAMLTFLIGAIRRRRSS